MALKDFTMYRDFKTLKTMIRNDVIRIMPKAHKYPDALYLKEHCGTCVRYMAAASITRDPMAKMNLADRCFLKYGNKIYFGKSCRKMVIKKRKSHKISLSRK
jgi:hypothetical protein